MRIRVSIISINSWHHGAVAVHVFQVVHIHVHVFHVHAHKIMELFFQIILAISFVEQIYISSWKILGYSIVRISIIEFICKSLEIFWSDGQWVSENKPLDIFCAWRGCQWSFIMIKESFCNTFEGSSEVGHVGHVIRKECIKDIFFNFIIFIEKYSNNSQIFSFSSLLICHICCIIGEELASSVPIGVN